MCLHTNRRISPAPRTASPTTPPPAFCWLSFDSQATALAGAIQHLKDFIVHIRHPKFLGDAKVVEIEPTKLVVAPHTANGFARPVTLDPRQIIHLHVYR